MQWLTNLPLGDNRPLQLAVIAGIVIVAIFALIIAYRALFVHRLRFSGGGKARHPRLGLVDALSLDGQRQLVIVRRDNVEHLLMIGGPNDIVVESQIVRAQPQALPRDKEIAAQPAAPPAPAASKPAPAPVPAPAPAQPPTKVAVASTVLPIRPVAQAGPAPPAPSPRPPIRAESPPPPVPPKPPQPAAPPPPRPVFRAEAPPDD